jgi:hypothetical protein
VEEAGQPAGIVADRHDDSDLSLAGCSLRRNRVQQASGDQPAGQALAGTRLGSRWTFTDQPGEDTGARLAQAHEANRLAPEQHLTRATEPPDPPIEHVPSAPG